MKERDDNCHGCKWLDEGRKRGAGYCHMVERSAENQRLREWLNQHREEYELGRKELPSLKVRRPDMRRCELYDAKVHPALTALHDGMASTSAILAQSAEILSGDYHFCPHCGATMQDGGQDE